MDITVFIYENFINIYQKIYIKLLIIYRINIKDMIKIDSENIKIPRISSRYFY